MVLSFRDEIEVFLIHGIEQDPLMHAATTGGKVVATDREVVNMLVGLGAVHRQALLKIADEIDKLRAATDNG